MRVLVACEESQAVTKAFREGGHEAYSCDLLPCSGGHPEWHHQRDIFDLLAEDSKWDLVIAHPPCTYLTVSGNRWYYHPEDKHLPVENRRPHPRFPNRRKHRKDAIEFFVELYHLNVPRVCVENPQGIMSTEFRPPDQYVQPYEFGDPHAKKTGLWLRNLPLLKPTNIVEPEYVEHKSGKRTPKWYFDALSLPKEERQKVRSKTFPGIAKAMVNQWGKLN